MGTCLCGSVDDDLGLELLPHLHHAIAIRDVANACEDIDVAFELLQLVLDIEQRGLRLFDEDHLAGCEAGHLSTHLRTDAPTGTGDEDATVLDESSDGGVVEFDAFASEKVFDVHRPDLADGDATINEVSDARKRLELEVRPAAQVDDALEFLLRRGRDRDDDFVDLVFFAQTGDVVGDTQDGNSVDDDVPT